MLIDLPHSTCWTQTYWWGCRSQSLPLFATSRYKLHGLAMFSPWYPADCHTCSTCIRNQIHTFDLIQFVYHLLSRVGGGDISAHRHDLTGSCSSTFQYSA